MFFHPLQVFANYCSRNCRFVVNEDDNGKYRLERVSLHASVNMNNYDSVFYVCGLVSWRAGGPGGLVGRSRSH